MSTNHWQRSYQQLLHICKKYNYLKISFLGVSCFRPIRLVLFSLWLSNYNFFDGAATVHLCLGEELRWRCRDEITNRTPTKRPTSYFSMKPLISLDGGILPRMQLYVTISGTHMQTINIHNVLDMIYGSLHFQFQLISRTYGRLQR